ncbi:Glutathione S-transferase kappa 1 [Branchiostoma belcheri]|nr:Glutathione S-transferase kappa 1 [Branchiostoma belcheri]
MATIRSRKVVELFYDVISPYSWVAFEVLCRYQTRWNIDLQLRPFFIGGVFKETGNKPPGLVAAKYAYVQHDLKRLADFYKIPVKMPPMERLMKRENVNSNRLLTAVNLDCPEHLGNLSREMWMRVMSRDQDISETASLETAAAAAGIPSDKTPQLLSRINDDDVKAALKATTNQALAYGAFGAPTIVAHVTETPVMLWGSDRFPLLAHILGEPWEGPLTEMAKY